MTLYLKALGGLALVGHDGAPLPPITHRRRLALLALLVAAGDRGVPRDTLVLLLWPESRAERGRHSLNQALYALRRGLGVDDLVLGTAELRVNAARVASDVAELERALERGDAERALALYRGPLLDGFAIPDLHELAEWIAGERARLADRVSQLVERASAEASARGDHRTAAEWWRRLATAHPSSARAALGLATSLAASGDRAAALHALGEHARGVTESRGAEPDPAVRALLRELGGARLTPDAGLPGVFTTPDAPVPAVSLPGRRRGVTRTLAGLAGAALLVAVGVWATKSRAVSVAPAPADAIDTALVAVAPFETFDSSLVVWREGAMDLLSHNLDGAGPLTTVAAELVLRHWRGRADPRSARALGRATGAGLVLVGTLLRAGSDSLRATARIHDTRSGALLVDAGRRDRADRMDRLTDSLTVDVLRQLEASRRIGAVAQAVVPATANLEALRAFLQGEQAYRRARWDSAETLYARAIELDAEFPLALRRLGSVLTWRAGTADTTAVRLLLRAGALNRRLGPRDSVLVLADSLAAAAHGAETLLGEWPFVRRLHPTLEQASRRWPGDPEIWMALGEARYHFGLGPLIGVSEREMLDAFDRAVQLDSSFAPAYLHAVELALGVGGRDEALRYAAAYERNVPPAAVYPAVRVVRRLLERDAPLAALAPLLARTPHDVAVSVRNALRRWPDSAETAVWIARALLARAGTDESAARTGRRRLAELLAWRGHVREAARLSGDDEASITAEVAFLGGYSNAERDAIFDRRLANRSAWARLAPPGWAERGDTARLGAYLRSARARLEGAGGDGDAAADARYDSLAAHAYLALARHDTAAALRGLASLPDTTCRRCFTDRLVRGRLRLATGDARGALHDLSETIAANVSPIEPLMARWRGEAAERAGDVAEARRAYRLVVEAWARADPMLGDHVRAARAGLRRVSRR